MRIYVLAMMIVLLSVYGCGNPKTSGPEAKETASMAAVTSGEQVSFELCIEKAKAETLGFTFARMADYFSTLKMSKHEYSTQYRNETFVIGMFETPEQLRRIMEFSLKTGQGKAVRVKSLCTVHHRDR